MVTGKAELAKVIQDGLEAHHRGDADHAVDLLGRARDLAEQCEDGNLLARINQIHDPDTGTIRLHKMHPREEMELDIESTKTTPLRRS